MKTFLRAFSALAVLFLMQQQINSQLLPDDFPEFHIIQNGETAPGYLFGSNSSSIDSVGKYYMIIDNSGEALFYSQTQRAGRLLQNGYFGTAFPLGPKHQYIWHIKDENFNLVDSFQMGFGQIADNHDFILLPNGHAIMLAYEIKSVDMSKLVEGGSPNARITGSIIQELDADRNVIYQWRCWDHIPILDTYKNVTKDGFDYIHVNSVELDHDGNLILSCRETSEIIKISRQTGETIWRWGGKNNDFTILGDHEENAPRYFKLTHSVRRLPNGNITIFDNGADKNDKARDYTRAVEYAMDEVNMEATMVWEFRHDPDILALTGGTVVRFPNGNTQINWGGAVRDGNAPAYTEANDAGELVYEISYPNPNVTGNFSRNLWYDLAPVQTVIHTEVSDPNTYDFIQGDTINTGVSVKIKSFAGDGYNEMTVKKESYGPVYPRFIGRPPMVYAERITLTAIGINTISADIILDLEEFEFTDPGSLVIYHREFPGNGLFLPLNTTYNQVAKTIKANADALGEFIVGKPDIEAVSIAPWLISPSRNENVNQNHAVGLEWSPQGFFDDFDLQIATDSMFSNLVIDTAGAKSIFFEFAEVLPNTSYYWRVRTNNDAGTSGWSDTSVFNAIESSIEVFTPVASENLDPGRDHWILWWDNLPEDVELSLLKDGLSVGVIDTISSNGAWEWEVPSDIELAEGYQIAISSSLDATIADTSSVFSILDLKAPDAVCVDTVVIYLSESGTFTVDSSYVDDGSDDEMGIASISLDVTEFDCDMLGENQVTITVTDVNGNSSTCSSVILVLDSLEACGTFIDPETSDKKLFVYPNPARNEISISYTLDRAGEVDIRLYDILGHEVRAIFNGRQLSRSYEYHMDLEGLPNGGYILMMKAGDETHHHKILLMK